MNIVKTVKGSTVNIELEGRLDTTTAPDLESELKGALPGATDLILDFARLVYISSAALRVVLFAQKTMKKQGKMVIRNVIPEVMDIFDMTGFSNILTIE